MAMAEALCSACADGNIVLTKALIERGADVNLRSTEGFLPLCLAAFWGNSDVAKLLLENGANIDGTNGGTNWTACHCAAFQGHGKVVMTLLEYNPRLNMKDESNRTAVDFASALDNIWPHFAARGCKRTSKSDLIKLKIVTKVSPSSDDGFSCLESKAYFSRPGSAYVVKPQKLYSQTSSSNLPDYSATELSGQAHAAFSHGDVLTEMPISGLKLSDKSSAPKFAAWRT